MKKIRCKFYIVLLFIFCIVSVALIFVEKYVSKYDSENIKQYYIDLNAERAQEIVIKDVDRIVSEIENIEQNIEEKNQSEDKRKSAVLEELYSLKNHIDVYNISIIELSYDENNVAKYKKVSAESEDSDYKLFVPNVKELWELKETGSVIAVRDGYYSDRKIIGEKVIYATYYKNFDWIIYGEYFFSDICDQADKFVEKVGLPTDSKVVTVICLMFLLVIVLVVYLCRAVVKFNDILDKYYREEKEETEKKYKELRRISERDSLLGCYNRSYINNVLTTAFDDFRQNKFISSVIIFDIDDFKKVNDTYGHLTGDAVLVMVANSVKGILRENDIVARWGGEEFIVFLKFTGLEAAKIVAEKVREAVEKDNIAFNGVTIGVTVSVGVDCFNHFDKDYKDTIERADKALYRSKKTGKNKVTAYTEI